MMMVQLVLVMSILVCSINADTNPSDAAALRVMFTSLNSAQQLSKWTENGVDPCGESWKGITCSGSRVKEIKISGLSLTGNLGYQVASLTEVTNLDVSNNNIQMPYQLPPKLQQLNLAGCGFTGGIAFSISQMTTLKYINLGHNQLQGQLSDMFSQLTSLSTLDLSYNSLTGDLPQSFGSLSSISTMNLQNNQFTGSINVLANLPLDNLNIANNRFSGWVPSQLKHINLQKDGNTFSSGPAPPPPPGTPPIDKGKGNHKSSDGDDGKKSGIGGGAIAGIVISILVVGAIVAFFIIKRRSKKRTAADVEKADTRPFTSLASHEVQEAKAIQTSSIADTETFDSSASINLKPPPNKSFDEDDFSSKPIVTKKLSTTPVDVTTYSIADLQIATDSFSVDTLVGQGSIGRVYRAEFDSGKVLALKKLNSSVFPSNSSEEFLDIVSEISRLRHQNITELVGYCSEYGQHLLIYEFYKNGSLHDFLHLSDEYSKPLTWNSRVKIALGTARALEYLHEVCLPSVIHKNFKSANILLDTELNPHLSDCGLSSLVSDVDQGLNRNSGSGYSAPEVDMSGQYTIKSDVYSFGVAMMELLTGRKPFDSSKARSEQSLVRWATPQLHDIDALSKMVDPGLKGLYPVKSLSRFADVIALCVQPEPEFRPPMSEVVEALVRLVQRANMSKRTVGSEGGSRQSGNTQTHDEYMG